MTLLLSITLLLFSAINPSPPTTHYVPAAGLQETEDYRMYQNGYKAVMEENWTQAIAQFENLAESYPESRMMPNASYWKCYAAEQQRTDTGKLLNCYSRVVHSYPDSRWAEEAKARIEPLARFTDRDPSEYMNFSKAPQRSAAQKVDPESDFKITASALRALRNREDFENWHMLSSVYRNRDSRQIRSEVFVLLSTIQEPAVADSLYQLIAEEEDSALFATGLRALSEVHQRAIREESDTFPEPPLVNLGNYLRQLYHLRDEADIRSMVIREIARTDIPGMSDLLLAASDEGYRYALYGLTKAGDKGFRQLVNIATSDEQQMAVRMEALGHLRRSSPDTASDDFSRSFDKLTTLLDSEHPQLAGTAMITLINLNPEKSHDIAQKLVTDTTKNSRIRTQTLHALLRKPDNRDPDTELLVLLRQLAVSDPDKQVSREALRMYLPHTSMEEAEILFNRIDLSEARMDIVTYLPRLVEKDQSIPIETVKVLMNASDEPGVQEQITRILHGDSRPQVISFLVDTAGNHPDHRVRQAAITVLGTIDDPAATRALQRILTD